MAVRSVAESYELVVIQGWWPDSRRVTDVDEQEPRTLRPQQVAIATGHAKHHFAGAKFAPQATPSMKISKKVISSRRRYRGYIGVREIVAFE